MIRVLTVDDHPLLLEGLAAVLQREADMRLVAEASSGTQALERFRTTRPDIMLLDLRLPDMSGIEVIATVRAEFREARIIVLTAYPGDILARRALAAGAYAYLLKETTHAELLETIRVVHQGQKRIQPAVAASLAEHSADPPLTARELQVLRLVAEGFSNRHIGNQLVINEETVKGHVKSLLAKLGARDRTHAISIAIRRGFVHL
jgi:DNA-binding NarL/FixJ family response regulator